MAQFFDELEKWSTGMNSNNPVLVDEGFNGMLVAPIVDKYDTVAFGLLKRLDSAEAEVRSLAAELFKQRQGGARGNS